MSKEAVKNLIKESQSDTQLLARLEAAEGSEAVIKIAQARGYEFTEDELILVMQEQQELTSEESELSEEALEAVAGGIGFSCGRSTTKSPDGTTKTSTGCKGKL